MRAHETADDLPFRFGWAAKMPGAVVEVLRRREAEARLRTTRWDGARPLAETRDVTRLPIGQPRRLALTLLLVLAVAACSSGAPQASGSPPTASAAPAANLTIYAAASLKAALDKVKATYEAASPGTTLTISTDSSTALETKIEQGAPADVFLSADMSNPQKLVTKGLAAGPVTKFADNLLTVIVPTSNPAGIKTPADLARNGVKVIAAAAGVPIQKYTAQLVANLARQPGYPANFADLYNANVASHEDNVGAVVGKVALGEGDAGIVYVTDARTSDKVTAIPVPHAAKVAATYGGVVVRGSSSEAAAARFLGWLAGSDGRAILASFGFLPPS